MKRFKLIIWCLIITSLSCNDDNLSEIQTEIDALKDRLTNLETRVDSIEVDLADINSTINTLKDQGKINSSELISLQGITQEFLVLLNKFDSTNSVQIESLKTELERLASITEFDSLSQELIQISANLDSVNYQLTGLELLSVIQNQITILESEIKVLLTIDTYQRLTGAIEKGAFLSGSRLFLYEIDSAFAQTGRTFTATIADNYGSFSLTAKNLKGKTCLAVASGFYINEVSNAESQAPITLSGIVKIDSGEVINVNVLTHLELPRVEYLISSGLSFDSAKHQAISEVLKVFGVSNPGITRSEKVGLIGIKEENDILASISVIMQGFRKEGNLIEILTEISKDLEIDGKLDQENLGDELRNHLEYIDETLVLDNLRSRYDGVFDDEILNQISMNTIAEFKSNAGFNVTKTLISYPDSTESLCGFSVSTVPNILHSSFTDGLLYQCYSFAANMEEGPTLKVVMERSDGSLLYPPQAINYIPSSFENWEFETDGIYSTGEFKTKVSGLAEFAFSFLIPDTYTIIFYERNGTVETNRKTIVIK